MSKRRGRGKDEGSHPPPPPSVLQGSLFPAVSFPKPCGGGARSAPPSGLLHVAGRGHPPGSSRAEEGRGRLERSSSSCTRFSFPGLVCPAPRSSLPLLLAGPLWLSAFPACSPTDEWLDAVCLLEDAEVSCSLVSEWKRSGEGPWERDLGAVSDASRQARGAKKFTHPESRSRKPVWPELRFPCKVAGVFHPGRWSGKESWWCVRATISDFSVSLSLSAGGGARCECCCLLSLAPSFSSPSSANREKSAWIIRNTTLKSRGCPSNWTGASSDIQAG